MNLNTKQTLFFLVLLFPFVLSAQAIGDLAKNDKTHKVISFSLGTFKPIAFGDSFINDNTESNFGVEFNAQFNIIKKGYVGVRLNGFGLDVTEANGQRLYDRSTVSSISILLGYRFLEQEKYAVTTLGGIGRVNYSNKVNGKRFNDNGTSYWFQLEGEFSVSRYFQIYGGPELRLDRLNIASADAINSRVNNINYLMLHIGMRVSLWNNEDTNKEKEDKDEEN